MVKSYKETWTVSERFKKALEHGIMANHGLKDDELMEYIRWYGRIHDKAKAKANSFYSLKVERLRSGIGNCSITRDRDHCIEYEITFLQE